MKIMNDSIVHENFESRKRKNCKIYANKAHMIIEFISFKALKKVFIQIFKFDIHRFVDNQHFMLFHDDWNKNMIFFFYYLFSKTRLFSC